MGDCTENKWGNYPIVFLVGADMCGKTQIAKELATRLRLPYYKASTEHAGFLGGQDRFLNDIRYSCPARLDILKQINTGIVYDRGYPCEAAYSIYFKRPTDAHALTYLDKEYAQLGAVIVLAYRSSYAGIKDDLDERLDSVVLKQLEQTYRTVLAMSKCRVLFLNVDDEDLEREVTEVLTFIGIDKETQQMMMTRKNGNI